MILVVLGTQDKEFPRLLNAIEKEIEKGNIKDKVIVQAGQTKYKSDKMEILGLLPEPEFNKLVDSADLIITHGGAGTILSAIKKGKKVIAAARLAKYKEHHNDHQKQIIKEFAKQGYILELKDFNKLNIMLKKSRNFKPKKFVSNTDNFIMKIENYIEKDNHKSWLNRCGFVFKYLVVLFIYFLIVWLLQQGIKMIIPKENNMLFNLMKILKWYFIPGFILLYFIFKNYVFKVKKQSKSLAIKIYYFITYLFFMSLSYMMLFTERSYILFFIEFYITTLVINKFIIFGHLFDGLLKVFKD